MLCLCSAVDGRRSCSGGCRLPVGHTPEWRSAPGCSIRMHPGSVRAFQSRYHLEHRALTGSRHRMVPSRTELHPYQLFRLPAQGWIDTRRGLTGLTRGNERLALTQYNLYCAELFISRPTHPRSLRTHQQPDRRKPKLRVRYLPSPTSIPTGWPPLAPLNQHCRRTCRASKAVLQIATPVGAALLPDRQRSRCTATIPKRRPPTASVGNALTPAVRKARAALVHQMPARARNWCVSKLWERLRRPAGYGAVAGWRSSEAHLFSWAGSGTTQAMRPALPAHAAGGLRAGSPWSWAMEHSTFEELGHCLGAGSDL